MANSNKKTLSPELTQLLEEYLKEAVELTPELKKVLPAARKEAIKYTLENLSEPNPPEGEELHEVMDTIVDIIRHRVMIGHPPSGPNFHERSDEESAKRMEEHKQHMMRSPNFKKTSS